MNVVTKIPIKARNPIRFISLPFSQIAACVSDARVQPPRYAVGWGHMLGVLPQQAVHNMRINKP